jgi:hypothetical protein
LTPVQLSDATRWVFSRSRIRSPFGPAAFEITSISALGLAVRIAPSRDHNLIRGVRLWVSPRFLRHRRFARRRPNPKNPRTHSKKQIKQIAASIRKFGFLNPLIVDDENTRLAGHGRLDAARLEGMAHFPIVRCPRARSTRSSPRWARTNARFRCQVMCIAIRQVHGPSLREDGHLQTTFTKSLG